MRHNELLEKIDSVFYEEEGGLQLDLAGVNNQYRAIRAVVELHSPCTGDDHDDSPALVGVPCICVSCDGLEYPCPTIQVIEKELG